MQDHLPLRDASAAERIIPLYIIEPELWRQADTSSRHWRFIHDSLRELQAELAACGAPLVIRIGEALEVLAALHAEIGTFRLYSHEETGNGWTYRRDLQVAQWCTAQGIEWYEYPSHGVVRRLKSRDGWASMREGRMREALIAIPPMLQGMTDLRSDALPGGDHALFRSDGMGTVQQGGRSEGLHVLQSFAQERAQRYMQTISKPGVSARHCSRLSTHIAYGTLSVREIEQTIKERIRILRETNQPHAQAFARNLSAFLSRLAWRCHFVQKLEQQPDIETKCMHPAFEGMREPYFREDFFEAWKTGRTGYPLIDACMRSLHENGWITFRMRALLVSFASYDLWLDWRQTAPFLATLFTDYEPGIHYSQFQMQSGVTGINAVRMYNPIKQSLDHDPQGKFIRRFVPELASIPDSFIHEPWRMESPPASYPAPIVLHEAAIRHARHQLAQRWKTEGFREEAQHVRQQLGSRGRSTARRTQKRPATPNSQLRFDF